MICPTWQLRSQPDCVVMVDAENLGKPTILPDILSEVEGLGKHIALHAYGVADAHRKAYERYGFIVRNRPAATKRHKNLIDMQLTVEAMEMELRLETIRTWVIVSSDGDFLPLVQRLSELGNEVVCYSGAGPHSSTLVRHALASLKDQVDYDRELHAQSWIGKINQTLSNIRAKSGKVEVLLSELGRVMACDHQFFPQVEVRLSWKRLVQRYADCLDCCCVERNGAVWLCGRTTAADDEIAQGASPALSTAV